MEKLTINNWAEEDRPREKMASLGAEALSNAELLAILIGSGSTKESAVDLMKRVLADSKNNLNTLGKMSIHELCQYNGIGEAKACSIVAAMELSKRLISDRQSAVRERIRDSRQVAELLMEEMMYEKRELFMTINLDAKLRIQSKSVISIGSVDSAPVHPREVFGPAIRRGASAVVAAHNHPSGDPTPSAQDIEVTKRLLSASEIIGIKLLDHVIIGNGVFTSMKSEGLMEALFR